MQQGKIDLVGAVGIRRMDGRLDVGRVVEEDIEDVVALMFNAAKLKITPLILCAIRR
jgi:hypothetical protein